MPPKRKVNLSDEETDNNPAPDTSVPPFKKPKSLQTPQHIPASALETYSREQLIAHIVSLQQTLVDTKAALEDARASRNGAGKTSALAVTSKENVAPVAWSAAKVAEKADKLADMCAKAIQKQMK